MCTQASKVRVFTWLCLALGIAAGCGHGAQRPPPTAAVDDAGLQQRLAAALHAKGPSYVPRTRHKNPDGTPKYTNRLILESSPYLLQHAHNPVSWFAWGDEAFERARLLHRPVFLSVGYSTCHWCHVMEEESFEDEEIARYLNENYVCIKVDREERPELDAAYMSFVQGFTGSGGWPMNVWLTPAREPFFGGTYFPPRAGVRGARHGLIDVLREQAEHFKGDPSAVSAAAHNIVSQLVVAATPQPAGELPAASVLQRARGDAAQRFDASFGGARGAPKFPSSFPLRFLLRVARRAGDAEARRMTLSTLEHMRAGGIYDQVGGGFHRYSTDAQWLVPHFEKMLYDNALLAVSYLEAAQASAAPHLFETVRGTLDYLLRDMTAPDGTFYSATDADSADGHGGHAEGIYFTWTPAELEAGLGQDDAGIAARWFGVYEPGNFEGRSILTAQPGSSPERIPTISARLLELRNQRPAPLRDEKVIVAWNGLAISAFARAAIVLGEPRYAQAALRAASAMTTALRAQQTLPHELIHGQVKGSAFADDYALLASALLDVFELTADEAWLSGAIVLMDQLERSFADPSNGGYYLSREPALIREKPAYDGPAPSVNSSAALAWLRLYACTEDERFRVHAETTLRAFAGALSMRPLSLDQMLLALDWMTDSVKEIVIVVPEGRGALASSARPLLDVQQHSFAPNALLVVASQRDLETLAKRVPWAQDKVLLSNRATAYVCEHGACKLPTNDPSMLAAQLAEVTR